MSAAVMMITRAVELDIRPVRPGTIDRLERWGMWSCRREDSGLGLPHQAPFMRLAGITGGGAATPRELIEYIDTERAVLHVDQLYRQSIVEEFVRGGTRAQKARACRCRKDSYERRLYIGMLHVQRWLDGQVRDEIVPARCVQ